MGAWRDVHLECQNPKEIRKLSFESSAGEPFFGRGVPAHFGLRSGLGNLNFGMQFENDPMPFIRTAKDLVCTGQFFLNIPVAPTGGGSMFPL
jgi:hypothetical protein